MSIDFKLPEVGENIDKADIGSLRVAVGDVITADQIVMEVETDKAVFELPCPHAGKVTAIHVKTGDTVPVGAKLLTIEAVAAGTAAPTPAKPAPAEAAPAASRAPAAPSPSRSPDPAVEPAAPAKATAAVAAVPAAVAVVSASVAGNGEKAAPPAPAGPATRRLARELGVDLHQVQGSGPGGRITPEDVQAHVRSLLAGSPPGGGPIGRAAAPPLPDFAQYGEIERQPLNKVMRTAAVNLGTSWSIIPHVTQHDSADVTELEAARQRYSQAGSGREGAPKITMTVLAMKALVTALKTFPKFNASYDAATGEVIIKKYYHIGVAVDTEQGLLVPVIRNADAKSVVELAAELTQLAKKARDRKLVPADMQGGSFTITNLGGIGGSYFTPIVNWPEVAILGMGRTAREQVVVDGQAQVQLILPLSLSYDHRVINGADGARFIVKLARLLSDPFQLLSEV
ncbi:MAG: 2-oxo acid dehydrogenase subunit E2 [Planctomycetaceae bacterium]